MTLRQSVDFAKLRKMQFIKKGATHVLAQLPFYSMICSESKEERAKAFENNQCDACDIAKEGKE